MIGGWLLVVEPGSADSVRRALDGQKGVECRTSTDETLVVVTETSADRADLEAARAVLSGTPRVRSADLVAVFEDEEPAPRRRGRRPAHLEEA